MDSAKKFSAIYFFHLLIIVSLSGCFSSSTNTINTTIVNSTNSFTWEGLDPNDSWQGVASSADGNKLVAVKKHGKVYTSINAGAQWTSHRLTKEWSAVASSDDGVKLVACEANGIIYTSINSGTIWSESKNSPGCNSVASSSDGSTLIAVGGNHSGIIVSKDYGSNWATAVKSDKDWIAVATSADGTHFIAAENNGAIYTSIDSGEHWDSVGPIKAWRSVASSADGAKLVAVASGDSIYTSSNSGLNWTARDSSRLWKSVASSSDGTHLVAATEISGDIYQSSDSGVNWAAKGLSKNWRAVASSASGEKIAAVIDGERDTIIAQTGAPHIDSIASVYSGGYVDVSLNYTASSPCASGFRVTPSLAFGILNLVSDSLNEYRQGVAHLQGWSNALTTGSYDFQLSCATGDSNISNLVVPAPQIYFVTTNFSGSDINLTVHYTAPGKCGDKAQIALSNADLLLPGSGFGLPGVSLTSDTLNEYHQGVAVLNIPNAAFSGSTTLYVRLRCSTGDSNINMFEATPPIIDPSS